MRKILIALGLLTGTAAAAQQPAPQQQEQQQPESASGDIVVVGTADRDKQVRDFVRALSTETEAGPMGRFDMTAVCPAVAGIGDEFAKPIAERMRKVAKAVGIEVAKPGCNANVLVILTRDKDEMIKAMRAEHPIFFLDATKRPVSIPKQRGPATAWHLEGRVDRSGDPVGRDPDTGYYVVNTPVTPSRISATMRPIFMASLIVIELDALVGLSTTQIADYAAMRTLAQIDPARLGKTPPPTILTVLEAPMDSAVPQTLTHWDLSYLKALYASAENHHASRQRGEIRKRMMKDLEQGTDGAED